MKRPQKGLYIVLSQTGTALSHIIKVLTNGEYNHASLCFSDDLQEMYSFGRHNPYNAFWAGFVKESPNYGTFKRFRKTKVCVLKIDIDEERLEDVCRTVAEMWEKRVDYSYNYLGLYLATVRIARKKDNCFYCSEFVAHVLSTCGIVEPEQFEKIIHPMSFLSLPHEEVYRGRLSEFCIA